MKFKKLLLFIQALKLITNQQMKMSYMKKWYNEVLKQWLTFKEGEVIGNLYLSKTWNSNGWRGLVTEKTVVLRRWGSETAKFGLSTQLMM